MAPVVKHEIIVGRQGSLRAIHSPVTAAVLQGVANKGGGVLETRRASHVEPGEELSDDAVLKALQNWYHTDVTLVAVDATADRDRRQAFRRALPPNKWWADMTPFDPENPVLGPFDTKEAALEAEVAWLREHNIPVCESCREVSAAQAPDPLDDDRDPGNPVEMTVEDWHESFHKLDDFEGYLDHDTSMNG